MNHPRAHTPPPHGQVDFLGHVPNPKFVRGRPYGEATAAVAGLRHTRVAVKAAGGSGGGGAGGRDAAAAAAKAERARRRAAAGGAVLPMRFKRVQIRVQVGAGARLWVWHGRWATIGHAGMEVQE